MPGEKSHSVLLAGTWNEEIAADTVLLDYDRRHRRRIALRTEAGRDLILDLPRVVRLRDGDGLLTDAGEVIRVVAQRERLAEIRAPDPATLIRIAWHLGNRHLLVQLLGACIRIRTDHVIEAMVESLGGRVHQVDAAFDPEAGAYAEGAAQHHDDHH
jgi:urease accessory protein